MRTDAEQSADDNDPVIDAVKLPASHRGRRRGKLRLLSRANIDGRTRAAVKFDRIANGICNDLGGADQLTTVQKHLVAAFAGCALHVSDLNAKLLLGQDIDIVEHSQVVSTLVRLASRIGVGRVARDLMTPSLTEYIGTPRTDEAAA
jgi:hypothetical protein